MYTSSLFSDQFLVSHWLKRRRFPEDFLFGNVLKVWMESGGSMCEKVVMELSKEWIRYLDH